MKPWYSFEVALSPPLKVTDLGWLPNFHGTPPSTLKMVFRVSGLAQNPGLIWCRVNGLIDDFSIIVIVLQNKTLACYHLFKVCVHKLSTEHFLPLISLLCVCLNIKVAQISKAKCIHSVPTGWQRAAIPVPAQRMALAAVTSKLQSGRFCQIFFNPLTQRLWYNLIVTKIVMTKSCSVT